MPRKKPDDYKRPKTLNVSVYGSVKQPHARKAQVVHQQTIVSMRRASIAKLSGSVGGYTRWRKPVPQGLRESLDGLRERFAQDKKRLLIIQKRAVKPVRVRMEIKNVPADRKTIKAVIDRAKKRVPRVSGAKIDYKAFKQDDFEYQDDVEFDKETADTDGVS